MKIELIKEYINNALKNNISDKKYPIEFENETGRYLIEEDGKIFIQPKQSIQYLELNINILPTSSINEQ
jgi:hypothetical protein